MPKERVFDPLPPYGDESPAVTVAEVSWSKEAGHVQLVTRCIHRATHEVYDGPEVHQSVVPQGTSPLTFADGFWANLDRRGINELIKYLRRARDQAFGRDE